MKLNKTYLALAFWLLPLCFYAQTKDELEKKKKQLQSDIAYTNKLLQENEQKTKNTLTHLDLLKKKISAREELIYTVNNQIRQIEKQIEKNNGIILSLKEDLEKLKADYARMLQFANRNRSGYNKLMFIFSSSDFNQAYKRMKYLQQYAQFRERQAASIVKTQQAILARSEELEKQKTERQQLKKSNEEEKKILGGEKQQQEQTAQQLQQKEKELKEELRKKQKDAQALQKAIEEIIRKEIEAAKKAAKNAGKTETKGFPMTPEAQKLSNSFAANKGKLPWPVSEGIITGQFGTREHPVLKGIMIENNGIDISTKKGNIVRAVFEGEVSSVIIIPGAGKCVMIRHGEYLSVYSYLTDVYVQKGDKVSTKQNLGIPATEEGAAKSEVHLEIWKGTTKLNPEYWIYK